MNKSKERLIILLIFVLAFFLRFWQLGDNPVSMYWDEVAIALDAYSFDQTGRDMNNMSWLQPVFASYGDFKAPIFILIVIPFVKILGMTALAVRLPIAIFSMLSLLLVYYLSKEILAFDQRLTKKYQLLPLLSLLVMAISPWPVHFARIGFESSLSVAFLLAALLLFLKGIRGKSFWLILSIFPATLAVYSYYSLRVVIPLLVLALIIIFFKKICSKKLWPILVAIFLFVLAMLPILKSPYYQRSQEYRLNNNNLIHPVQVIVESSHYLEMHDSNLFSRLFYHRYIFWSRDFLQNFISHFNFNFLFINGDSNLRHHSGYLGEFFVVFLPFYLWGACLLFKNIKSKISLFLLALMLLTPIPAAMVYEVPHASRAIYLFVPVSILIAWGLNDFILYLQTFKTKSLKIVLTVILFLGIVVNAGSYYLDYFMVYPKRSSAAWLYPYNQVALYLKQHQQDFKSVEIDGRYWFPELFIYYQFPELILQIQELKSAQLSNAVSSFGLPNPFDYLLDGQDNDKKTARFVYYDATIPEDYYRVEDFDFLNGEKSLKLIVKDGIKK